MARSGAHSGTADRSPGVPYRSRPDEGVTTAQVGDALGYSDYKTTARYQRRQHARLVGQKVSGALFRRRRTG
jgi:hypothetical protein